VLLRGAACGSRVPSMRCVRVRVLRIMEWRWQRCPSGTGFSHRPACTLTTACGIIVVVPPRMACRDLGGSRMPNEVCGQVCGSSPNPGDCCLGFCNLPASHHPLIHKTDRAAIAP
jgi:hypothetical protein